MDRDCGAELPVVLFHGGDALECSAITLKGTEGEKNWEITNRGIDAFRQGAQRYEVDCASSR